MKCYHCNQTVTDIAILKHGLHPECFNKCFSISNDLDFENVTLKQASKDPAELSIGEMNTSFFHGMFKKYSAEIGGEQYILKVAQGEYPELPLVEWLSNIIAKELGINVAEFYFIKLHNEKFTFVTKNFMHKKHSANLIHIYHFLGEKQYSCEDIMGVIDEKCGRLSDTKEFINMCLFDAFIGNHDRHGRNLAIIQQGPSKYTLSPIYDNPGYIGIEETFLLGADLNPKGRICTLGTKEPTLKDYVEEFIRLGHEEVVTEFINKIKIKTEKIIEVVTKSDLSDTRKKAFLKIIEKRRKEI